MQCAGNPATGETARHLKAQVLEPNNQFTRISVGTELFRELRPTVSVIVGEKCSPRTINAQVARKRDLRRRSGAAVVSRSGNQPPLTTPPTPPTAPNNS